METTLRIIIIASMIHLTDSFRIISSANATDFLEGSPAALTCIFPVDPKFNRLQWENVKNGNILRCRNLTTCDVDHRFELSRNGYNMNLIIKKVKPNQNKWSCSDNTGSYIEFVTFNVFKPPPEKPVITVNKSEICVGEQMTVTCEWRGGRPSASVNLTCLSVTKTSKTSVTISETVTLEMSHHCQCEGMHVAKYEFTTYNISILSDEKCKKRSEDDVDKWLIVGLTLAALVIVIIVAILCFKYHSNSRKKKIIQSNSPTTPKLDDKPTANTKTNLQLDYDNLQEQQEDDKSTEEPDYETIKEKQKGDELSKHVYANPMMLQKEDEPTENFYHTVETPQKEEGPAKRIYVNPARRQTEKEPTKYTHENPALQQKD